MTLDQTANFVRGKTTESVDNSQTTISVNDANTYPDPSNGNYNLILWDANNHTRPDQDPDVEIVRISGRDTGNNTITVSRGQESTSAVSHPSGSALHLATTSAFFADVASESQLFSGSHTDLSNISSNDHHAKYTDSEAQNAVTGSVDAANLIGGSGSAGQFLQTDGSTLSWADISAGGISHVQTTEPAYAEGATWLDPSTGILRVAYDAGNGGDYHPVPPVETTQEVVTFTESSVNLTHNDTKITSGSVELKAGWVLSGGSQTASASINNILNAIWWKPDGTKFYGTESSNDLIYEYDASTAWDVTTLTSVGSATFSDFISSMYFRDDGTTLFIGDRGVPHVRKYSLSTAWDITTASAVQTHQLSSEYPRGMWFKPDGTTMYLADASVGIKEYDLSTAWDISTISAGTSYSTGRDHEGLSISPDGKKVIASDSPAYDEGYLREYEFGTPWDVSTLTEVASTGNIGNVGSLHVRDDGSRLYYGYQDIYEWTLPKKTSGDVVVEYADGSPADIESWDLATFQATLDNESVTVDVEDANGNVLFSDISQNFDISTVANSTDVRFHAYLSRNNTSNNPTLDYLARRYVR